MSRGHLASLEIGLLWFVFFATSVYGHVALKLAVASGEGGGARDVLRTALSPLGASAMAAWTLSGVVWMLVLSRQRLLDASSISALRYVLICLCAWLFLQERLTWQQAAGAALICAGIALVR